MEEINKKMICGFWRRIAAFIIDVIILSAIGFILGLLLEDVFVQLGEWGRLIGFIISISYFGIMNSSKFDGQTFGKKLFKIQVVDSSNSTIGLSKSFLRYSFLAALFSLNGIHITDQTVSSYLAYPLSFIIFGGVFSIVYLYLFNRVTRQSLHDLMVGTYVVNISRSQERFGMTWRPHLFIVSSLFVIGTASPEIASKFIENEPFQEILLTQQTINKLDVVRYAGVMQSSRVLTSAKSGNSSSFTYVSAQVNLYEKDVGNNDFARELAELVVSSYPDSRSQNLIQISLIYGYDIGIWSKWYKENYSFNPNEI